MAKKKETYAELFVKLAKPNKKGKSRWVNKSEFTGEYKKLELGNGGSWIRPTASLAKKYIIRTDKKLTPGNSIDAVRLNGFNTHKSFNQAIRADIKAHYANEKCVMLGVAGFSENTKIEIDHKDGRKDNARISNQETQTIDDFQPLCKAANDVKRQICKRCKATNKRWSAKNIKGNPYPFYEGDENYDATIGCEGCYQYDPVKYRVESVKRISAEASDFVMKKLFNSDEL